MSLRQLIGRVIIQSALAWQRLKPGTRTLLLWLFAFGAAVAMAMFLGGCSAPAPAPIKFATPAAVAVHVKRAQAHVDTAAAANQRAIDLVQVAVAKGISAHSPAAQQLEEAAETTTDELAQIKLELAAAGTEIDKLTAQLLEEQKQTDVLAAHDKSETARASANLVRAEKAEEIKWKLIWTIFFSNAVWLIVVSILGASLQTAFRDLEAFMAKEALAVGATVVHEVEKIPAIVAGAAKVGALAALV